MESSRSSVGRVKESCRRERIWKRQRSLQMLTGIHSCNCFRFAHTYIHSKILRQFADFARPPVFCVLNWSCNKFRSLNISQLSLQLPQCRICRCFCCSCFRINCCVICCKARRAPLNTSVLCLHTPNSLSTNELKLLFWYNCNWIFVVIKNRSGTCRAKISSFCCYCCDCIVIEMNVSQWALHAANQW